MTIMPIIISITRTVIIMTLVIINILALITNFVFIMKILIRIILITIILIQRRQAGLQKWGMPVSQFLSCAFLVFTSREAFSHLHHCHHPRHHPGYQHFLK